MFIKPVSINEIKVLGNRLKNKHTCGDDDIPTSMAPISGHFSNAWLAATRGVKKYTQRNNTEIDVPTLCNHMADFITSSSRDPKKRFSLRLSAILLNGTVKIYRAQVLLLEAEVIYALQYILCPVSMRASEAMLAAGVFESPPTPIPRVKSKRAKRQIVETPTTELPEPDFREGMLQLPEVEDILQIPPATSDMISLREEAPRRRTDEVQLEEEGFGIITGNELEMEIESLFPKSRAEPVPPLTTSSESLPLQVLEVVALVHAERGEFREELSTAIVVETPKSPEKEVERVPDTEVPVIAMEPQIPMEIVESEIAAVPKEVTPIIEALEPTAPKELLEEISVVPEIHVLREIQPLAEPIGVMKDRVKKEKRFLVPRRRVYARINRCNEDEGRFSDEFDQRPSAFRNVHNEYLYNLLWSDETVDGVRAEVRAGSSKRSSSLATSLGLGRTPGRQRSTLEKDLTADSLKRVSVIETPQKEMPSLALGEIPPASQETPREPPIPVRTPSREKPSIIRQEPSAVTMIEEPSTVTPMILEELPSGVPSTTEVSVPMETIPSLVAEVPQIEEVVAPVEEPKEKHKTPVVRKKKEERVPKPSLVDDKVRQQKIIDIVKKWNFAERLLTIEDICGLPMTKLNMARAFSDLLVLTAKQYLALCSEEESLELKYIKKGPRLMGEV
ncbi:hypothetical protein JTB14_015453 [Gonioctena quinquepunctata]|nr:hypothetical protein JTB14_015453 [Gonioctena quinquepunctata]